MKLYTMVHTTGSLISFEKTTSESLLDTFRPGKRPASKTNSGQASTNQEETSFEIDHLLLPLQMTKKSHRVSPTPYNTNHADFKHVQLLAMQTNTVLSTQF